MGRRIEKCGLNGQRRGDEGSGGASVRNSTFTPPPHSQGRKESCKNNIATDRPTDRASCSSVVSCAPAADTRRRRACRMHMARVPSYDQITLVFVAKKSGMKRGCIFDFISCYHIYLDFLRLLMSCRWTANGRPSATGTCPQDRPHAIGAATLLSRCSSHFFLTSPSLPPSFPLPPIPSTRRARRRRGRGRRR